MFEYVYVILKFSLRNSKHENKNIPNLLKKCICYGVFDTFIDQTSPEIGRHYLPYLVTTRTITEPLLLLLTVNFTTLSLLAASFHFYVRVTLYKFIVLCCGLNLTITTRTPSSYPVTTIQQCRDTHCKKMLP